MSSKGFRVGELAPRPVAPVSEQEVMKRWSSDGGDPVLTICCITYNHAPFIADALNGFLCQETNFPFEVIVHDDASTDGTQQIVLDYQKKYPTIIKTVFQQENQYSKGRRMLGFFYGLSNARYLAVCEGDDYWLDRKKLQKQVDYLESEPDCVITGHDSLEINDKGEILRLSILPDDQKRDRSASDLAAGKSMVMTRTWVYRNVVEEFASERNMVCNGDAFFLSILGEFGGAHYHTDIEPAVYRVHAGGVWSLKNESDRWDEMINTWYWMYRYYKRVGQFGLADVFSTKYKKAVLVKVSVRDMLKEVLAKSGGRLIKSWLKKILGRRLWGVVERVLRKV